SITPPSAERLTAIQRVNKVEPVTSEDSMEKPTAGAVSRRSLLKTATVLAAAGSATLRAEDPPQGARILAYVGAYTPNGAGIYLFAMNSGNGNLTQLKVAAQVSSPSWLEIHPNGRYLYAVNEISNFNGTTSGSVSAFSINRANGDLTF